MSRLAAAGVLLLLAWPSLFAEPSAGRIVGEVLDPQWATVSGAQLSLINGGGTAIRETTSDAQGNFVLDGVAPGSYQVSADAASFVSVITNVGVAAGQQQRFAETRCRSEPQFRSHSNC